MTILDLKFECNPVNVHECQYKSVSFEMPYSHTPGQVTVIDRRVRSAPRWRLPKPAKHAQDWLNSISYNI